MRQKSILSMAAAFLLGGLVTATLLRTPRAALPPEATVAGPVLPAHGPELERLGPWPDEAFVETMLREALRRRGEGLAAIRAIDETLDVEAFLGAIRRGLSEAAAGAAPGDSFSSRVGRLAPLLAVARAAAKDRETAVGAWLWLAEFSDFDLEAAAGLAEEIGAIDPDAAEEAAAASTFATLARRGGGKLVPLAGLLRSPSPTVQRLAAVALRGVDSGPDRPSTGSMPSDVDCFVPALLEMLDSGDSLVGRAAARTLEGPILLRLSLGQIIHRLARGGADWRDEILPAALRAQPRATIAGLIGPAARDLALDEALSRAFRSVFADESRGSVDSPTTRALLDEVRAGVLPALAAPATAAHWAFLFDAEGRSPEDLATLARTWAADPGHAAALTAAVVEVSTEDPIDNKVPAEVSLLEDLPGRSAEQVGAGAAALQVSPELFRSLLVRMVKSGDPVRGAAAIGALSRDPDPRLNPVLRDGLALPLPLAVELDCALALLRRGDEAGAERLHRLLSGPIETRPVIVDRICAEDSPEAFAVAADAVRLDDKDATWHFVKHCFFQDAAMPLDVLDRILASRVLDPKKAVVFFAAFEVALGPDTRAHVTEKLLEGKVVEKAEALRYVAIPADPALRPLVLAQLDDPDPRARAAALDVLTHDEVGSITDRLLRMVVDGDPLVRMQLCRVFDHTKSPIARGVLIALSRDQEALVREAAVLSLATQPNDQLLVAALTARLNDAESIVRNAARVALLLQGRDDLAPELIEETDDLWTGARSRRALSKRFGVDLADAAAWREWWRLNRSEAGAGR